MRTVPRLSGRSTISGQVMPENGCSGRADRVGGEQHDVTLHVGRRGRLVGAEEAARIGGAHREQAAPAQHVAQPRHETAQLAGEAGRSTETGCVQR